MIDSFIDISINYNEHGVYFIGGVNMSTIQEVTFNECEDIKCVTVNVHTEDEGKLLRVPVYVRNVCPHRKIIVGVRVYIRGKLYAMKVRKIFTNHHDYCRKIRGIYAGDFEFLFTDNCIDDIYIDILSHYIR